MANIRRFPTEYTNDDLATYGVYGFGVVNQYPVSNAFNFDEDYTLLEVRHSETAEKVSRIEFYGFDFSSIPASANISNCQMYIKYRLSSTQSITWVGYEAMNYIDDQYVSLKLGDLQITETTSEKNVTIGDLTKEQLEGLLFDVYVVQGASSNSANMLIETIYVQVTYEDTVNTPLPAFLTDEITAKVTKATKAIKRGRAYMSVNSTSTNDIRIDEGTSHWLNITVQNEDGSAMDLNGCTAVFTAGVIEKSCGIENNVISVKLEPDETKGYLSSGYQIRIFDENDDVFQVVQGVIYIRKAHKPYTQNPLREE